MVLAMNGTIPAESLVLATGLFPKRAPVAADLVRSSKLHNKVEASLRRFLRGDKPEKWEAWERPPGQEDLHLDLCTPVTGEGWDFSEVTDIIHGQWLIVLNQAKKYLADKWPIYDAEGLAPANFALSDDEYADVWELVRSVDGIAGLLADLESYVLTREQIEAFRACYPDFYESIDAMLFFEMSEMVRLKRDVTWQQEDMIRVLRGIPDEGPLILQQPPSPPANPPTGPQQQRRIDQTRPTPERIEANETT
jgi:hypothetical protein